MVKGNLPQFVSCMHSDNPIYGSAKNPLRQDRTSGGSCGGDAGLVAANCIPIGVGSDNGGSIRGPSAFCGIFGFKPTF